MATWEVGAGSEAAVNQHTIPVHNGNMGGWGQAVKLLSILSQNTSSNRNIWGAGSCDEAAVTYHRIPVVMATWGVGGGGSDEAAIYLIIQYQGWQHGKGKGNRWVGDHGVVWG